MDYAVAASHEVGKVLDEIQNIATGSTNTGIPDREQLSNPPLGNSTFTTTQIAAIGIMGLAVLGGVCLLILCVVKGCRMLPAKGGEKHDTYETGDNSEVVEVDVSSSDDESVNLSSPSSATASGIIVTEQSRLLTGSKPNTPLVLQSTMKFTDGNGRNSSNLLTPSSFEETLQGDQSEEEGHTESPRISEEQTQTPSKSMPGLIKQELRHNYTRDNPTPTKT